MGLDMYAYRAAKAGQQREFYDGAEWDENLRDFVNPNVNKPEEIAYWRKHPHLHGWFNRLWESKGNSGSFNGDELELTLNDLLDLEITVNARQLPATQGFFFGTDSSDHYLQEDLKFIALARQAIKEGDRVFYNSSW